MRVDAELKRKRTDLLGEAEELAARIAAINAQVSAIEPSNRDLRSGVRTGERSMAVKPRRAKDSKPLPPELARINKSAAILEVLREADRPLSTADCTCAVADRHDVAANDPALSLFATHISAALNSLMKRNRVRQAGTVDGRKHLWEIAA